MFSLLAGLWDWFTRKEELRFLIVGIDNAGKTSILERLKTLFGPQHQSNTTSPPALTRRLVPTIGLNLGRVSFDSRTTGVFWDLGGQLMLRSIWENHFMQADGIIFVVDSRDSSRFAEVRETLHSVLMHSAVQQRNVPLLLLANKQDCREPPSESWQLGPLSEALGLLQALHNESVIKLFYSDQSLSSAAISTPAVPPPPPPPPPPQQQQHHFPTVDFVGPARHVTDDQVCESSLSTELDSESRVEQALQTIPEGGPDGHRAGLLNDASDADYNMQVVPPLPQKSLARVAAAARSSGANYWNLNSSGAALNRPDSWIPRLPIVATRLIVVMAECSALTCVNVKGALDVLVIHAKRRRQIMQQKQQVGP